MKPVLLFRRILSGLGQIVFPNICVCCGHETTEVDRQICSFCLEERFQSANPDALLSSGGGILPEYVGIQHALWKFDKGGALQDLLHYLKYERLTTIGRQLGEKLGESMKEHPSVCEIVEHADALLVPVPLHYLKFRRRGFNQAFMIAGGIQRVWDIPICGIKTVVRCKNTRSQTGFSLQKRIENVKNAFTVKKPGIFSRKVLIIVDDVFTTGSTTFELARTLSRSDPGAIMIVTIAQA